MKKKFNIKETVLRIVREEMAAMPPEQQAPPPPTDEEIAQNLVDNLEGDTLDDTVVIQNFFIRQGVSDPRRRQKILRTAKKILDGEL